MQDSLNEEEITDKEINNVRYEIENQEMTPEECDKVKLEIRQAKERVNIVKEQTH